MVQPTLETQDNFGSLFGPSKVYVSTNLSTKFVTEIPREQNSTKQTIRWLQGADLQGQPHAF
jgi:hypothetical protein